MKLDHLNENEWSDDRYINKEINSVQDLLVLS